MKKISLALLGTLLLSTSALGSDAFRMTPEESFKSTIKMSIERGMGDDAHALFHLDTHKKVSNISCVVKEGDSFKELSVVAAGAYRQRSGNFIIRPDEQTCWNILKANYHTLQYEAGMSRPRDMAKDIYGNEEYLVFTMGNPTVYVIQAPKGHTISEFVKKLNTKQ